MYLSGFKIKGGRISHLTNYLEPPLPREFKYDLNLMYCRAKVT